MFLYLEGCVWVCVCTRAHGPGLVVYVCLQEVMDVLGGCVLKCRCVCLFMQWEICMPVTETLCESFLCVCVCKHSCVSGEGWCACLRLVSVSV